MPIFKNIVTNDNQYRLLSNLPRFHLQKRFLKVALYVPLNGEINLDIIQKAVFCYLTLYTQLKRNFTTNWNSHWRSSFRNCLTAFINAFHTNIKVFQFHYHVYCQIYISHSFYKFSQPQPIFSKRKRI